jgi:transposase
MSINEIQIKLLELKTKITSYKLSPEVRALFATLVLLIEILLQKQGKNSRNSSIPPSQDPNRPKNKKLKNKRKSGGQKGHKGFTLEKEPHPDEIIPLKLDRRTLPKGHQYKSGEPETRQVKDFEVTVVVTEYQAEVLLDENGTRYVAEFPSHVTKAIQYGSGVKTNAVYMSYYQMSSLERIEDHFSDQLKINLSEGSLYNFGLELYGKLEPWDNLLKVKMRTEALLHADETGVNVNGNRLWLHALCNPKYTLFSVHAKRGKEAMDEMGILPHFKGYLCHDHWKPYFCYFCHHILCNAHYLRELTYLEEMEGQIWAKKMREFLLELNDEVKAKGGRLSVSRQEKEIIKYQKILKDGEKECPLSEAVKGKRGKVKQSKARNLLERFQNFEKEILGFMMNKLLPFTNNQGENDLRMTKVKLKVAGCFRSLIGAHIFARIRGFINTCKKNDINVTEALRATFDGNLEAIIKMMPN